MGRYPVVQATAYCLIHAPSLVRYGTTVAMESERAADSSWLAKVPAHLRSFKQAVAYPPHQTFIGNVSPWELAAVPRPWYQAEGAASRFGPFGEIMPEAEFYGAMALADSFQLVRLCRSAAVRIREGLAAHPCYGLSEADRIGDGTPDEEVERAVADGALPLYLGDKLAGCVNPGHSHDPALSAHVMFENLVAKASGALALKHLLRMGPASPDRIEYLLECSEEACGDMNQRGGGNFAKAIGELAGCVKATGSDVRAFCAAPAHALVQAGALVQSGVYRQIAVLAGGATAKLGMNARDHVLKGLPVLEDVIGAFAVLVGSDDGASPVLRTDLIGRHPIGAGASPQAVMQALVMEPLDRAGLKVTDVGVYGAELHNPEILESSGAGDVAKANLKMIGALGTKRGDIERADLDGFTTRHGTPGFAPTQGHIPSGVPLIGHACKAMSGGRIQRAMIIGKGSLFLGRMTNLFDGVSLLLEANPSLRQVAVEGPGAKGLVPTPAAAQHVTAIPAPGDGRLRIGITVPGSELGDAEVLAGARRAQRNRPDLQIVQIGGEPGGDLAYIPAANAEAARQEMESRLTAGDLAGAVTMHYNFPRTVASVGRVVTPGHGREMLIATVTGMAAADRVEAMIRGAVYGQAVAQALGNPEPTVGLLNLDGAAMAERLLRQLRDRGYPLRLGASRRADGGALLRGNDVSSGEVDVLVTDTLTGNALVKLLSTFTTGGGYESAGYGYGPGVGPDFPWVINIISRASGAPVIANALAYAGDMARANLPQTVRRIWQQAMAAGVAEVAEAKATWSAYADAGSAPAAKPVSREITGIDVLQLEAAAGALGKAGIYAVPGMGCTGPVMLVAPEDESQARAALTAARFLG